MVVLLRCEDGHDEQPSFGAESSEPMSGRPRLDVAAVDVRPRHRHTLWHEGARAPASQASPVTIVVGAVEQGARAPASHGVTVTIQPGAYQRRHRLTA
jgi:hypothetical protein